MNLTNNPNDIKDMQASLERVYARFEQLFPNELEPLPEHYTPPQLCSAVLLRLGFWSAHTNDLRNRCDFKGL